MAEGLEVVLVEDDANDVELTRQRLLLNHPSDAAAQPSDRAAAP